MSGSRSETSLLRDPMLLARIVGALGGVLWVALVWQVVLPLAALGLLLLVASSVFWASWRVRQGRDAGFRGMPLPVVAADMAAAAVWMAATANDPNGSISFGLVLAAGTEAIFRLGRRGLPLIAITYALGRIGSEVVRAAYEMPFDLGRDLREAFVVALILIIVGVVASTFRNEERRSLRALERAQSLERVAAEIGTQVDPEAVLLSIPRTVRGVVDVDHAALIVHRGHEYEIVAGAGTAEAVVGVRAGGDQGIVGDVVRERRSVLLADYQAHPTAVRRVKGVGLRAVLAVPIFVQREIAAVLMVGRLAADRPFDDEDRVALEGFASHAAIALTNARAIYQARRLEVVGRMVASEGSPEEVVVRLAEHAASAFNAEFVQISEVRGDRIRVLAAIGAAAPLADSPERPIGVLAQRTVSARSLVVTDDYLTEYGAGMTGLPKQIGLHAAMSAPALIDGRVAAVFIVGTTDPDRAFDLIDRQGMIAFGESTGAALRAAAQRRERERRIQRLTALNGLAGELSLVRDPLRIARLAWETAGQLVPRDAFYVARYDDRTKDFHFILQEDSGNVEVEDRAGDSWSDELRVPLGTGPTSQVVLTGEPYVTRRQDDPVQHGARRYGSPRKSASAMHVPLRIAGRTVGVLSSQSYTPNAFDDEDVAVLQSLANLVAAAFETSEHLARMRELYLASVKALAAAVDARDPYTRSHSARVAALSRIIAEEMQLPSDEIRRVQLGALLHDIGKIGIPDAILNKPAALTDEEWVIMKTHSSLGASILAAVEPLRDLVPIVKCHHERNDGGGYPDGLRGEQVPLSAYIVSAADAFEVIVSRRAYKAAQTIEYAVSELLRCRGTQFSPVVVDAFLRVIERDRVEGTVRLARVGSIEHEDIEDVPGPGEVLERYAARSQTRTRQLAILQRLASEISAVLDLDELGGRLLKIVCEANGYENGFLTTLAENGEHLVVVAANGPSIDYVGQTLARGQGISWWVLEHGELQNVPDVHADTRFVGPPDIRSSLIVPLRMGDERVGVLGIESTRRDAFTRDDEDLLTAVSHQIAASIRVARLHRAAQTAATTDALTGLPNRRVFLDKLSVGVARSADGIALSVAVVDVNLLKAVNDHWGHAAGDKALELIGEVLASGVRGDDTVTRIGGDEFGIVFPGAPLLAAERIMRRLAEQIASSELADGKPLPTIAWGIASAPGEHLTADAIFDAADRAMYRQKEQMRRRSAG
ncbi:MAG: GAF domain-containing protein [Chloroflexi bacterium]|nr:GAF domain-containing protein [Chloroflexota bacterium]